MPSLSTPGLVIRRSDYHDYDRMVTLFTPEIGRVDAIARGCRRPKSPLLNAVEPFVSGEFQLWQSGERFTVEQCQISESYFELRADYDRLVHGAYWLRLLDAVLQPDSPMPKLFVTTLRALAYLNYSELSPEVTTMAFEMHLMAHNGMSPRMDACALCGQPIDGDARFDAWRGGTVCLNCPSTAPRLSNGARRIIMKLPRTAFDKFQLVDARPEWPEAAARFREYVNAQLHMEKFAPPLKSLS